MSKLNQQTKIVIAAAKTFIDPDLAPLLDNALTAHYESNEPLPAGLKTAVLDRIERAKQKDSDKITVRPKRLSSHHIANGIASKILYEANQTPLRAGEPTCVTLIELSADSVLKVEPISALQRDYLVVRGDVNFGDQVLTQRDYRIVPAGLNDVDCASENGALLLVRESNQTPLPSDAITVVYDDQAGWPEYAPGIARRVLWARNGQAAMLYLTQANASVPDHSHHHDEECFMVAGELYLDDTLLLEGDYQLAKASSGHVVTHTDTGVVLYAHGDLDLAFK